MANKEEKGWFVEAQKWTQHLPQEEVLACPHAKKTSLPSVTDLLLLLLPIVRFPHWSGLSEVPSSFYISPCKPFSVGTICRLAWKSTCFVFGAFCFSSSSCHFPLVFCDFGFTASHFLF
jgi:hypothetical protein